MSKESNSPEILTHQFSQDLTAGALSTVTAWNHKFKDPRITMKASEVITENVTVTLDSPYGSTKDVVLDYEELSANSSYAYPDTNNVFNTVFEAGFEIILACTNANVTGTVSGTITATKV